MGGGAERHGEGGGFGAGAESAFLPAAVDEGLQPVAIQGDWITAQPLDVSRIAAPLLVCFAGM